MASKSYLLKSDRFVKFSQLPFAGRPNDELHDLMPQPSCTGRSVELPADECSAWIEFFVSMKMPESGDDDECCSQTDPCSINIDGAQVKCSVDGTTIQQM
jgi:hypothetical protein